MAIFNEILVARFARALQKQFGIKGEAPTKQLAGEVMPVFPFPVGVEFRVLDGWSIFGVSMSPTGGAGQSAGTRLRNPVGSNCLAVVEGILVSAAAQVSLVVEQSQGQGDLTTVQSTTTTALDRRSRPQPACVPSQTVNFGALPAIEPYFFQLLANTPWHVIPSEGLQIPLLPGDSLDVIDVTVATNISVSYRWRERTLEESENLG